MKSLFHKLLIVCCALYLSGAHWLVLQTTAWTGMLISRVQQGSLSEAVESTFDGKHPCKLCHVVDAGQKQEKKQEQALPQVKKLQDVQFLLFAKFEIPPHPVTSEMTWHSSISLPISRADAPPTPPPLA